MTSQSTSKRLLIRWTTLKGLTAIILFLALVVFTEYLAILYALTLGVTDASLVQWSFQFPGTGWPVTIVISPLFHLVPMAVILTLIFSWVYLTRQLAVMPQESWKGKIESKTKLGKKSKNMSSRLSDPFRRFGNAVKTSLLKVRGISYIWRRIHFARATIRSALIVVFAFAMFAILFSLLTNPQIIYRTVVGAYRDNVSFRTFVISIDNSLKGFSEAVSPLAWIGTAINNALLSASPAIRDAGSSLGNSVKPFAELAGTDKYLVFQNTAAWLSALTVLFYGSYARKSYRRKRK